MMEISILENRKNIIETDRLILREYTNEDFPWLYKILSDPETMKYYPRPYDEAGVRRWLEWSLDNYEKQGFGLWVVELKATGEPIGDAGITLQPIDGEWLPEVGYHISKHFWRMGYGSEAARAARDWAFRNTDYPALYSYMNSENIPSEATARANGMTRTKQYDDGSEQLSVWRITRDEWEKLGRD